MTDQATEHVEIPERARDLLTREKKAFANLALVRHDGRPHVSPVWFDWDGEHIILNTARGRVKDRILARHPKVSLSIMDPSNSYRYVIICGEVVDETEEGGYDRICDLNLKYKGERTYPKIPGQVRVTYKVRPESVFASK
jgi:PPOX class probable F420-dependent enzyme